MPFTRSYKAVNCLSKTLHPFDDFVHTMQCTIISREIKQLEIVKKILGTILPSIENVQSLFLTVSRMRTRSRMIVDKVLVHCARSSRVASLPTFFVRSSKKPCPCSKTITNDSRHSASTFPRGRLYQSKLVVGTSTL